MPDITINNNRRAYTEIHLRAIMPTEMIRRNGETLYTISGMRGASADQSRYETRYQIDGKHCIDVLVREYKWRSSITSNVSIKVSDASNKLVLGIFDRVAFDNHDFSDSGAGVKLLNYAMHSKYNKDTLITALELYALELNRMKSETAFKESPITLQQADNKLAVIKETVEDIFEANARETEDYVMRLLRVASSGRA